MVIRTTGTPEHSIARIIYHFHISHQTMFELIDNVDYFILDVVYRVIATPHVAF